ncbi:MAG: GspH/FimT family pseudopilin [Gammaproteobacteria bacterium]|nr:GspH/FimT family pseudopilin [Gammaproteobacteria bacterium]MDP2139485.1 GspH/FimT family pseudopilin [Gammaproteobacteria bacterium]MDP2346322.1 GspH/FimT family pseudopilin [Gammaproteobacteria bacterium]
MHLLNSGFSLIESLICIIVFLIIVMSTSLPGVSSWRKNAEIDNVMHELMSVISMARAHAIAENVFVTLCRSDDGEHCQGNWNEGFILFTDHDANRVINGSDRILSRSKNMSSLGLISYNSFQNKQYLMITPRGFTDFQNGNFTFCSADGDPKRNRQIIVSLSGRARYARDRDGDGVVENSQGRPVTCL